MLRFARAFLSTILAAGLSFAPAAQACTSFLITTKNGEPIYGRTMEFGFPLNSEAVVVPRGFAFQATDGKDGWSWNGRYALVGMNAFSQPLLADGMNEKGLTGGILYFPGYADYVPADQATPGKAMAPWEFLTWALSNFATTDELRKGLEKIEIAAFLPPMKNAAVPPFHYTFHDTQGRSIVVEPLGGKLKVWDNPVGVMTNSPEFGWHLTNLKNYVNISPVNAGPLKLDRFTVDGLGQGTGLLGIPGDPTPPSRFVRALGMAMSSERQPDTDSGVRMAEHIVNNFDIPAGFIRSDDPKADLEITQWSTVADMTGLRYYVKTENHQVLREIDLNDFDLDAKEVVSFDVATPLTYPKLSPPRS